MAVQVMNRAPISPFDTGARSVEEKTFQYFFMTMALLLTTTFSPKTLII